MQETHVDTFSFHTYCYVKTKSQYALDKYSNGLLLKFKLSEMFYFVYVERKIINGVAILKVLYILLLVVFFNLI